MIRLIGILVGLGFAVMALWAFGTGAATVISEGHLKEPSAEHFFHKEPKALRLASDGPFGKFDRQELQRGYQVYKEVCKACHSLRLVAFRDLAGLGYTEGQIKAEAASWMVPGIDDKTGEETMRPALATDYFPKPFANDIAARAANNNAIPPDLSLMAKAREGGAAYIYSLLTGYTEQAGYKNEHGKELLKEFPDAKTPTGLYFNPYFANLNIAMPPPLATEGQVTYADGTKATVPQMAKDVAAFLVWTAEPTLEKRNQTGWPVVGFLLFACVLAWMAKRQVWAPVKPNKRKH
jgi:ubiquinol-cytochrome c reductase cytochrome c1 subunit